MVRLESIAHGRAGANPFTSEISAIMPSGGMPDYFAVGSRSSAMLFMQ
jgi:hypothetical protein